MKNTAQTVCLEKSLEEISFRLFVGSGDMQRSASVWYQSNRVSTTGA
jgi:hypothetical protein